MANMAIRGWISQMGPCYTYEDPHQTIARVKSMAQRWALDEIPSSHDLQGRWQRAHARWCRLRKGIMERGGATSGGFARHVVFSVLPRRGDGASSGAPSPSFSPSEEIVLYTDGCCLKPSHVGGWAYILHAHSRLQWLTGCGGLRRTTSNRVELIAAIKGFRRLAPGTSVVLISDSTYVVQGINENLDLWRARGWRAGSGRHRRPLRNADLWQRLDELLGRLQVTCRHVPGHAGHRENELCDQLAREEAILLACGLSAQHRTKITT
jgi:ribonuclease HI